MAALSNNAFKYFVCPSSKKKFEALRYSLIIILIDELDKNLGNKFNFSNLDKLFQVILKSATYELLYKPNVSIKIIIKEYLDASNFFLDDSQTKYLNALLDNIAKKIRLTNARI